MSAQPQPQAQPFTVKDARNARQTYQHVAHVVNRIVNQIIQSLPAETAKAYFKPTVFATIHSLHGFFNGREVSQKKPTIKAHKFVAPHFDYHGDLENAGRFMDRRLDALAEAEAACGRHFIQITRADNRTLLYTSYEGHPLLDAAEWVYLQARSSPDYWKNPAATITTALLDQAIKKLPEVKPEPKPEQPEAPETEGDEESGEQWESADLMAGSIVKGMWSKVINGAERALVKEFDTGGDPELAAQKAANKIIALGKSIKLRLARERLRTFSSIGDVDQEGDTEEQHSDKNSVYTSEGGSHTGGTPTPVKNVVVLPTQVVCSQELSQNDFAVFPQNVVKPVTAHDLAETSTNNDDLSGVSEESAEGSEPTVLPAALDTAAQGMPVLPLWGVADGICDCPEGSECRSAGKHPHSTLARKRTSTGVLKGVYSATTDAATTIRWFEKDARLNYGIAMGGDFNLIAVDIDPRNGGDLTYCDLVEAHGPEAFPKTRTIKTGGGGWHKLYRLSEAIKPKAGELKGKLGPGVDIKGAGGLIVGPGSVHVSGRYYEIEDNSEIARAPEWIENALRKAVAGEQPEKVIDFQAHRDRKSTEASDSIIVEGERNERLFRVGCALWAKGEVSGRSELYTKLLTVNLERVSPPLDPSEVVKITESISSRYPFGGTA